MYPSTVHPPRQTQTHHSYSFIIHSSPHSQTPYFSPSTFPNHSYKAFLNSCSLFSTTLIPLSTHALLSSSFPSPCHPPSLSINRSSFPKYSTFLCNPILKSTLGGVIKKSHTLECASSLILASSNLKNCNSLTLFCGSNVKIRRF